MPLPQPSADKHDSDPASSRRAAPGSAELQLGMQGPSNGNNAVQPQSSVHRGWYDRGRLPHFDAHGLQQLITYRLSDSLPRNVVETLERELLALPEDQRNRRRRQRIEDYMDAGHGSCMLRHSEAAASIEQAWRHFDGQRYDLLAWVVMPNHVHVLINAYPDIPLATIIQSWKSFTGRRLAAMYPHMKRPIWQREYWDRFIRDENHFQRAIAYIHDNPVTAGLSSRPDEWRWSSARHWLSTGR